MFEICPFMPTANELQELLETGITLSAGEKFDLMNLDNVGKKMNTERVKAKSQGKPLDFPFLMSFEIFALIAAYLDPVDLISSRRVSRAWNFLLSSDAVCTAALRRSVPPKAGYGHNSNADMRAQLRSLSKCRQAYKTGRPYRKASFVCREVCREGLPNTRLSKRAWTDYCNGIVAWRYDQIYTTCCLKTGVQRHLNIADYTEPGEQRKKVMLSDRYLLFVLGSKKLVTLDTATGLIRVIPVRGLWGNPAIRGHIIAYCSQQNNGTLNILDLARDHTRRISNIPNVGNIVIHERLDVVISLRHIKIPGRIPAAKGMLASLSMYDFSGANVLEILPPSKYERILKACGDWQRKGILQDTHLGTAAAFKVLIREKSFGCFGKPDIQIFVHDDVVYHCKLGVDGLQKIGVKDFTGRENYQRPEFLDILYEKQNLNLRDAMNPSDKNFAIPRMHGDGRYVVQLGLSRIDVWCFDEDTELYQEDSRYWEERMKVWKYRIYLPSKYFMPQVKMAGRLAR